MVTAALAAAVAVLALSALPPRAIALDRPDTSRTVSGVLHVHSQRSDGRGTREEIAAAARRAGIQFVAITDHGDANRPFDPPAYIDGVLMLDGVEISTNGGHYIALGMRPSPFPLRGEARDVIEDVRRLGGFGIAAHPDSPKGELRWREWAAPFDALELVNLDTSWRVHVHEGGWRAGLRLFQGLLTYPIRAPETMGHLVRDSSVIRARWDALGQRRRVIGVAGSDAHARLAIGDTEPGDNRFSLPFPGYESIFRTLSIRLRVTEPLAGDAAADAERVLGALRAGRVHTSLDAFAAPPFFEFTATNRSGTAEEGGELPAGGPTRLRVRSNAPRDFQTTIWQGNETHLPVPGTNNAQDFTREVSGIPGVYRVEIHPPGEPAAAWIVSNPIYIRSGETLTREVPRQPARAADALFDGRPPTAARWRFEHDNASQAALDVAPSLTGVELRLRFALAGGPPSGQVAALVADTPQGVAPNDRLSFTARADRQMRISVQVRVAVSPGEDERWQRSVYVDTDNAEHTIFLDDFTPVGTTRTYQPPADRIHTIVFAVETTNTRPGTAGRLWIVQAALER
jgi:hypothetical protein